MSSLISNNHKKRAWDRKLPRFTHTRFMQQDVLKVVLYRYKIPQLEKFTKSKRGLIYKSNRILGLTCFTYIYVRISNVI